MTRAARRALAALAPLALAACESQWYPSGSHTEMVRTDVVVETAPPGSVVWFNGERQDAAPVRIPVEYHHTTEQWFRQSNQGAAIRESTGTVGTILLFPIWIPASFLHAKQELKRHVYTGNFHDVSARAAGHDDAEARVELQGEAEVKVRLELRRR